MRNYRDLIIYTDYLEEAGVDSKGRPTRFSLCIFDSPIGEGEHKEIVGVNDWDQLESWRRRLAVKSIGLVDFKKFAQRLGELILPPYARQLYLNSYTSISSKPDEGLRIRLRLLQELTPLPWEYALIKRHDGEITDEDYWSLDPRISVVRHEAIAVPAVSFGSTESRRVIVAMANPMPHDIYPDLHLKKEWGTLKAKLKDVPGVHPEYLVSSDDVRTETGATRENIQILLQKPADIFHFSGHGDFIEAQDQQGGHGGYGTIILADKDNLAEPIEANTLSGLLANGHIRLVILNACESGERDMFLRWSSVATALVKGGIPAIIAMQFQVYNDLATEFTRKMYEYMVGGLTIDEAVTHGRRAMREKDRNEYDWGAPVLYLRNSGGNIFRPVTDIQARLYAEKAAEQDATLSELVMKWTREGTPANLAQLMYLEQGIDTLHLLPLDALLLLRSAVVLDQETGIWVGELRKEGTGWLEKIQAPLEKSQKAELPQKLLGLDSQELPDAPDGITRLAWSATHSQDPLTGQTAALALLAIKPKQAVSQILNALPSIENGTFRRRRRAALIGALADADPAVAQDLPRELDNLQDRSAVWWWRVRKRFRRSRENIARWTFGGALGGALALAVYRAVLAVFNSLPVGTEFAINSYWGFLVGLGLVFGTVVAAPLLLQDPSRPVPDQHVRVAVLAVFLGALGFSAASGLVVWLNGISLGLSAWTFLRFLATSYLVGLGLSLGLYDQPRAGWNLKAGGWAKRLGIVVVVLMIVQLPVLCEALIKPGGGYWLNNAQWLAAPIIQPSEAITVAYSRYPFFQTLFDLCHPGENGQCCFACQAAGGGPSASNLFSICFEQWLSILDAALVGIVLCMGVTAGLDFSNTGLGKRIRKLKIRWSS